MSQLHLVPHAGKVARLVYQLIQVAGLLGLVRGQRGWRERVFIQPFDQVFKTAEFAKLGQGLLGRHVFDVLNPLDTREAGTQVFDLCLTRADVQKQGDLPGVIPFFCDRLQVVQQQVHAGRQRQGHRDHEQGKRGRKGVAVQLAEAEHQATQVVAHEGARARPGVRPGR